MFSRKHNHQTVGEHGTSPYTNVPAGAGYGGTANYPSGQKVSGQKVGYGYDAKDVNAPASQKAGYVAPGSYPASQKAGYVAPESYPASQKAGYVSPGSYPASQKAGYGDSNVVHPQQGNGYESGYVQQTPVSYGPDGTPVAYPVKKRSRVRNWVVGALAVCCCCIAL